MKIVLSHFIPGRFALTLMLLFLNIVAHAQGVDDAVINAQTCYEGTGRSVAMGNATGALGGDVTATYINPAGLGLYRSSEMTFTTGLQHTLTSSSYYNESHLAGKTRVSIPNFGYVITMPCSNYKPLRYLQFGVALTRTNDLNYRTRARGFNPNSSMVDDYLQTINGIDELFSPTLLDPGDILSGDYPYDLNPAWQTYLIDRFQDSLGYYYGSPIPQGNVYQQDEMNCQGRNEEWTLSMSVNIYDKLFIGSSLGLAHLKRISSRTYTETPANSGDPENTFTEWSHQEDLSNIAWGVNFKCGILYYPTQRIRFGASWQSRTHYSFDEEWSTITEATLLNQHQEEYHKYLSPNLSNTYSFLTPHRFTGSVAFFAGEHGLISLDADYLHFGQCRFMSDEFSFSDVNADIAEVLHSTFNLRLGTEWSVRQFFLRGGLAYYGSPYGFNQWYGSQKKLALGIGYATHSDTTWDFAYELTESTSAFTPYQYYVDGKNIVSNIVQHRWRSKFYITLKVKVE